MERAVTVSVYRKGTSKDRVDHGLEELKGLVEAAGANVVGSMTQAREEPEAGLGRGALEQLAQTVEALPADLVVFDHEVKPSQLLVVQNALGPRARVVDRTQIILDIFATRATSREGRLQVELAQYQYLEPRLRGMRAFSRPGGGIGTRGPGETYLELDRRRIRRRIHELNQELETMERQRRERRLRRRRTELPQVTLVGYTNVGKSTLYSVLTRRPQAADNALFVTLDPTVRRMVVPEFGPVLVSDTVGFVDRLPHELVAAFRSTLDEVRDADLILEVVSADPDFPVSVGEQLAVIDETCRALEAGKTPRLRVYSQCDRAAAAGVPRFEDGVAVSALAGWGLDDLLERVSMALRSRRREERVRVKWSNQEAWKVIWREFVVVEQADLGQEAELVLRGSEQAFHMLDAAIQA